MPTTISRPLLITAAALLAATGVIHLVEAPEYLSEQTYVGVLFFLNAVGCAVALIALLRSAPRWAWGLGVLVTGGAFVAFILSRTTGLPGFKEAEWDTLGIVSLIVEGAFCLIAMRVFMGAPRHAPARRRDPIRA